VIPCSINLIPEAPVCELVELGRLAEQLGYDRCWVYDEGLATRDVYVTLAALAAATRRIRLGTGITNPYTRHPATTAVGIASLDEQSGGRAFLGLGAGGSLTLDPLGIERTRPLNAVRSVLTACRRLLDGETVDLEGEGFALRGARIGFPVRAGIEIWIAGRGPKMLALGGELADGVMLDFIHKPSLGSTIEVIHDGGAAAGRRAKVCYSTMIITDDVAMAATKPHMTYRLVDSPPSVKAMIGLGDRDVERIRSAMAGGLHAAAEHVRDEWVFPFVIAGTVSDCAAELGRLVDEHGIDEFLLPVLDLHHAPDLMGVVAQVVSQT
jgi:5,10-methylenetetrahydromethanopterin reductase